MGISPLRMFMRRIFRKAILVLFVVSALAIPATACAQNPEFFFFSPDFGPGNLSGLTEAAEAYFDEAEYDVGFQPFARFEDFEREYVRRKPQFVVAPQRVVKDRCLSSKLLPLAHPVRGGQGFGRRSLMAGPAISKTSGLKNGSVAATLPSGSDTIRSAALAQLRHDFPSIRIIPVPKDIDALLAVGFGQVDAAFVSNTQFGQLAKINPRLTDKLHDLGYTEEIPFPTVYATEFATPQDIEGLRSAMHTINETGTGKRLTALLGYDGWNLVNPADATPIPVPDRCKQSNEESKEEKEGSS